MSDVRKRKTVAGDADAMEGPTDSLASSYSSETIKDGAEVKTAGSAGARAERKNKTNGDSTVPARGSFVSRHLSTIFPIVLTALAFVILPRLNKSNRYPPYYGICTFDSSVYITPDISTQCVVVLHGRIFDYGTLEDTRNRYGDLDRTGSPIKFSGKVQRRAGLKIYMVDRGHAVIPGLTDAHGHILEYGHSLTQVSLQGSKSVKEVVDRIVAYIDDLPADKKNDMDRVIQGKGFDQTKWPGAQFPTAQDLDVPELSGRKIFLVRVDLHACWISPSLMASLDIPEEIPGGVILRDEHGSPTGVFLDTAYEWILGKLPAWTDEDRTNYLFSASDALLSQGIVGVHDAASSLTALAFYKKLDIKKLLPIRIYAMTACTVLDEYCGDQVERYDGGRLTIRAVKLFLDGALGSWGAAMLEPYSDKPDEKGIARMPEQRLRELVGAWIAKGFQVNTHAIGDAANRMVVQTYRDALAKADKTNEELRLRIEHAQIMTMEDVREAGRLGLIASFQPTHCTSDVGYVERRLGKDRLAGAYAWQSLYKAGSPIAIGSDFPVEDINPFEGMYSSVTRLDQSGKTWYPEERLSRQQALHGFTLGAAYASFAESQQGTLEIGKRADIVILDRDIMRVEAASLRKAKVLATIVDGGVVYGRM